MVCDEGESTEDRGGGCVEEYLERLTGLLTVTLLIYCENIIGSNAILHYNVALIRYFEYNLP